ncbi:HAMP domain-containing sensor histidine kinase [Anoxynatronum sibiricum]|uniref:histidine kinase n=1 Tax=Anoxynatronum sibiricum TaxID=210623 RepID=A0ABU9VW26_9CLOT
MAIKWKGTHSETIVDDSHQTGDGHHQNSSDMSNGSNSNNSISHLLHNGHHTATESAKGHDKEPVSESEERPSGEGDAEAAREKKTSHIILPQVINWISFMALAGSGAVLAWLAAARQYEMQEQAYQALKWVMLGSAPLLLGGLVVVAVMARRAGEGTSRWQLAFDRMPNDVHTLLVMMAAGASLGGPLLGFRMTYPDPGGELAIFPLVVVLVVLGIDGIIGLNYYYTMIRQLKNRSLLRNTLVAIIVKRVVRLLGAPVRMLNESVRTLFHNGTVGPATMLLFLAYGLLNGLIAAVFAASGAAVFFFLGVFNALVLAWLARPINAYATLCQAAHHISRGEIDYPLNPIGMPIPINGLGEDMSRIQDGLRKAVAEAVKGERMKSDLITNVSHDLKTPLTAIISYVDLLQKEGPGSENAAEYLQVLEEKTGRLKRLIEDLVEASKASSGNVKVFLKPVDLNEVLVQAAGEFEDRMAEAGLELRLQPAQLSVWVMGDGTCLWRMLDNLLSNALKYSLKGTRVYAGVESAEGQGLLVVKNVSAQALNVDPHELTERFVRGDESRTTEGSGLGLAIAMGLAEAQQGHLTLSIDGDLFKAQVALPQAMPPASVHNKAQNPTA